MGKNIEYEYMHSKRKKSLRNFWPIFVLKIRGKKFPFVILAAFNPIP